MLATRPAMAKMIPVPPSRPALLGQRKDAELLTVKIILVASCMRAESILIDSIIDQARGPEVITTAVINLCNQIVSGVNSARHLPKYIDWTAPWERFGIFQSISTGLHRGNGLPHSHISFARRPITSLNSKPYLTGSFSTARGC